MTYHGLGQDGGAAPTAPADPFVYQSRNMTCLAARWEHTAYLCAQEREEGIPSGVAPELCKLYLDSSARERHNKIPICHETLLDPDDDQSVIWHLPTGVADCKTNKTAAAYLLNQLVTCARDPYDNERCAVLLHPEIQATIRQECPDVFARAKSVAGAAVGNTLLKVGAAVAAVGAVAWYLKRRAA